MMKQILIEALTKMLLFLILFSASAPFLLLCLLVYFKGFWPGVWEWWPEGFWIQIVIVVLVGKWVHNDLNR